MNIQDMWLSIKREQYLDLKDEYDFFNDLLKENWDNVATDNIKELIEQNKVYFSEVRG